MKAKVNKLEENSKNKNIREMNKRINEFKKRYQPRACAIKKDDGTIVADGTSILSSNLLHVKVLATKQLKYTLQSQKSQSLVL